MSEKKAKAERKENKKDDGGIPDLGNHLFDLTISIYDTGKFAIFAPEGSHIPMALDCCIRACHQLWTMIVKRFSGSDRPVIVPGKMMDVDILAAAKRQAAARRTGS